MGTKMTGVVRVSGAPFPPAMERAGPNEVVTTVSDDCENNGTTKSGPKRTGNVSGAKKCE
jgi:hypothetical protein